ncbi:MAG: caspase family protein [Nitrospiraceae bacterium]|nr:caspase family protein [Nitrospiraceae bacterium]
MKRGNIAKVLMSVLLAVLIPLSVYSDAGRGVKIISIKDDKGKDIKLYKESYALIIGASNYTAGWPKLPGVKKDVEEVKEILQKHGFNVTVASDPNREQLIQAFEKFVNKYGLKPDNRLLFYFAGHGHTIKQTYGEEMGYIIPIDAPNPNRDKDGFLTKAMDMQMIEVFAKRIQSKHAMFLFDSCFSGSIFALTRAVPENISYKTATPVRQFITSGSAEETVPDKSIFLKQFVSALSGEADRNKDGYVTGTELGEYLQDTVINYSKGSQHPQYGKIRNPNLDKGDFVFQLAKAMKEEPYKSAAPYISSEVNEETKKLLEEKERLRKEREELAQAKALLEEKKQIEAERKRLEAEKSELEKKRKEDEQTQIAKKKQELHGIYTEPSGAVIKPDFWQIQGVWKDKNSRSRNMRITIDNGRISIYCWDTQDSEVTQVSNILWEGNALKMVTYTPSTGYRNNIVLRIAGPDELRGTSSGSWNGEVSWIRLSAPDQ